MHAFDTFYIKKFEFDSVSGEAKFFYNFDNSVDFTEILHLYAQGFERRSKLDIDQIQTILFHLSIALSISYYKLFPTKQIIVESGQLSQKSCVFWKKFFLNGLGEFFYVNHISPSGLCNFVSSGSTQYKRFLFSPQEKVLLPLGGGKDSIVSSIILEQMHQDYTHFVFGKIDEIKKNVAELSGKKILFVQRTLSPNLVQMNSQGYYNGHVPITGIISFVTLLVSYLYGYQYIAFSNEKSASEENTTLNGLKINHQYSKSLEFERDFREYIAQNISDDIQYFSLLRNLYEIQIAQIFATFGKKYFQVFSSCNKNFKISGPENTKKGWCNDCPKCLFAYSILRPYMTQKEVYDIWGEELYDKPELKDTFLGLIDTGTIKPFECVGEKKETQLAAQLALEKNFEKTPYLLEVFKNTLLGGEVIEQIKYDTIIPVSDFIPKNFQENIANTYEETQRTR